MATDAELVSKEEHELNYLLKKWNKTQSGSNRKKLSKKIDEFNAHPDFRNHNRKDFYKYVGFMDTLE
ncbi:MAG: hypothetical protein O7A08_11465 [SAR324 cluster bacterium]|nr:hypothetical protein [SAR324 cluster bacterium]